MKKFLVTFLTPVSVMDNWMSKPEDERKAVEEKMKTDFAAWIDNHKANIIDMPSGTGRAKAITKDGTTDTRNDIMMYAVVQAENEGEAVELFTSHPHLEIPEASIQVMGIKSF